MKHIKNFNELFEARVLDTRYGHTEEPLKDNDTIRVYHGFNYSVNALQAIEYGLSGKGRVKRIYSYEIGNNPKGLFVTVDFDIAKKFSGGIIIEFQCKVSDLEAPVWKDGNYGIQGQFVDSFKDEDEREGERMRKREINKSHNREEIANSDRPELAGTIFDNAEKQALFIGDLNPNMIRAIWVNSQLLIKRRLDGEWERMDKNSFMKKYGQDIKDETLRIDYRNQSGYDTDYSDAAQKLFLPKEDFDIDIALDRVNTKYKRGKKVRVNKNFEMDKEDLLHFLTKDEHMKRTLLHPKQIAQVEELYK